MQNGLGFDDVLGLTGDKEKTSLIIEASRDVKRFLQFRSIISTGVTINYSSVPFERMMIFGWIKDVIDERKD